MTDTTTAQKSLYIELKNVLPEDVDSILEDVKRHQQRMNSNENYVREIGKIDVGVIKPERVRVTQTKEERNEKRRVYLRNVYNKKPEVVKKRKEYLLKPDIIKKRKEYAKQKSTKIMKRRNQYVKSNIVKELKEKEKQRYNALYLKYSLLFDEKLKKDEEKGDSQSTIEDIQQGQDPSSELETQVIYSMETEESSSTEDSSCDMESDAQ